MGLILEKFKTNLTKAHVVKGSGSPGVIYVSNSTVKIEI
jgi:hypothetical protein